MITYKDILAEDAPELRMKCDIVQYPVNDETKKEFELMMEYVNNSQQQVLAEEHGLRPAVGIAAPQIGVLKKMTYIKIAGYDGEDDFILKMLNPVITKMSNEKSYLANGEGCLSVKRDTVGYVERYEVIEVTYQDYDTGRKVRLQLSGYESIVAQHEIDHLNGVMFIDKLTEEPPVDAKKI